MRSLFVRVASCLLVGAAVVVGSGCGAADVAGPARGSERQPEAATAPRLLASVDLRLPVEDYMLSEDQLRTVATARVLLVERCLARFGVRVSLPDGDASGDVGPRSLTDRRYGITDAALAGKYAFGLGPRDPALRRKPPQPDLGVDGRAALTGQGPTLVRGVTVPEGGCLGEADRLLDAGIPSGVDTSAAQSLQFASFDRSRADSRVRKVFAAWSACMAESGYHYADPLGTPGDPRFTGPGPASALAIATARADLRCKARTNVVGVWFTVDAAYERSAIEESQRTFIVAKQALHRRLANAESAIADSAPGGR
ncbi:MAG: hypothetical protein QOE45_1350 [Frankiaceae bacterium]|jgi:hypothetical protein|nr:hypothetical protein [Frankiaceae bacterium]